MFTDFLIVYFLYNVKCKILNSINYNLNLNIFNKLLTEIANDINTNVIGVTFSHTTWDDFIDISAL